MSFACATKLTSFRPKILQAAVAVSRLGLTTMLIHRKKTSVKEVFLWCTRVDELLNSIVDETSDINEWKNENSTEGRQ